MPKPARQSLRRPHARDHHSRHENTIGNELSRILTDAGYRGHNAPDSHVFRVFTTGQKRSGMAFSMRLVAGKGDRPWVLTLALQSTEWAGALDAAPVAPALLPEA